MSEELTRTEEGRFPKGVSGNPAGRPKGSKNKLTLIREKLEGDLATDADDLLQTAITLAKAGSENMLRVLLDRVLPVVRDRQDGGKEQIKIEINNLTHEPTTGITINGVSSEEKANV